MKAFRKKAAALTVAAALSLTGIAYASDAEELVVEDTAAAQTVLDTSTADACSWNLSEDGTLTVSGVGSLDVWEFHAPWETMREQIKRIVVEEGITSLCDHAFYDCQNLTSVQLPQSLKAIDDYAFYKCRSLTEITLPSQVIGIGEAAFDECSSLQRVALPDGLKSIWGLAFAKCTSLTSIDLPSSVSLIDYKAFLGCTALEHVGLPSNGTVVCTEVFSGCTALNEVVLPDGITRIKPRAFANCTSLTSIRLPGTLDKLEARTFTGCSALQTVELADGIRKIEAYACAECPSLRTVIVPRSVRKVEPWAFYRTPALEQIKVSAKNPTFRSVSGALLSKSGKSLLVCPTAKRTFSIPSSVIDIQGGAFYENTNLTSIVLPNHIKTIGSYAFANCTALTSVTLSNRLKEIPEYTFSGCPLRSVRIPASVKKIRRHAFDRDPSRTDDLELNIAGAYGSAAERYAEQNGYSFTGRQEVSVPKAGHFRARSTLDGRLKLTWDKNRSVSSYIIQYTLNSKTTPSGMPSYQEARTVTVSANASSKRISDVRKGLKYHVRIRSCRVVGGRRFYSAWSDSKGVRIKDGNVRPPR